MTTALSERGEKAHAINGVDGRLFWYTGNRGAQFAHQRWISVARFIKGYGSDAELRVEIRFDDECKNGQNTFAVTADVTTPASRRRRDIEAGGCMHDEIARVFPELEPLIRWHLVSADGPMHYEANTIYHAGDRDCNGLRAGESRQIRNGRTGRLSWKRVVVDASGAEVEQPALYIDSDTRPECSLRFQYVPWERIGEGKARELDHARSTACWPEATDEQLCSDPETLRAMLRARLPGLLEDFRTAIEGAGFAWSAV